MTSSMKTGGSSADNSLQAASVDGLHTYAVDNDKNRVNCAVEGKCS